MTTKSGRLSRRDVIAAGAAGTVALGLNQSALGQVFNGGRSANGPPDRRATWGRHALLQRISYGATLPELSRLDEIGWDNYLHEQLNPAMINDGDCASRLRAYRYLEWSAYQCVKGTDDDPSEDWEVVMSQITRAVYSKRQLLEVMTEFWLDHFNIYQYNVARELIPDYVRTIRRHAFSPFPTLLAAVAKHPAMLYYLDNLSNYAGNNNQNFSREFLELHSMGVDGGYTEADVHVLTKIFTGWHMEGYWDWPWDQTTNTNWGKFAFVPEIHDESGGYFLGNQPEHLIPPGGLVQGETVIQRVATHPSTARFICRKLLRKFVNYAPHHEILDGATQVFLSSNGDIRRVMLHILRYERLVRYGGIKLKRPYHLVVGAMRQMQAEIGEPDSLIWELLYPMKQIPLWWAPPNGYPDAFDAWAENMRPRWYMAQQLPLNWLWQSRVDIFKMFKSRDKFTVVDAINIRLFGGTLPVARREQLLNYLGNNPNNTRIRETIGLALASPEYQLH